MPDDEKRVPLSLKVRPSLKSYISSVAEKEERNENNVAEVLLTWAALQLRSAGDTLTLKSWVARPPKIGESFLNEEGHLVIKIPDGRQLIFDIPSAVMRRLDISQHDQPAPVGKKK